MTTLFHADSSTNAHQKYCCKWGWTEVRSAVNFVQIQLHIPQTEIAWKQFQTSAFVINLASVPGRQLVNSPTAQSLDVSRKQFVTVQKVHSLIY